MGVRKPVIHGRDHLLGGADPIPVVPGHGGFSTPLVVPVLMGELGVYDGTGWTKVVVNTSARFNAVRTNGVGRTAAIDDSFSFYASLGPRGSLWGMLVTYYTRSDGGKFRCYMASVTETTSGLLSDTAPGSYLDPSAVPNDSFHIPIDTYAASSTDESYSGYFRHFRIMGSAGDVFTTVGVDDELGGTTGIDGGPGVYSFKFVVEGKHASSSGYRCDITGISFVRLNDIGFYGGF